MLGECLWRLVLFWIADNNDMLHVTDHVADAIHLSSFQLAAEKLSSEQDAPRLDCQFFLAALPFWSIVVNNDLASVFELLVVRHAGVSQSKCFKCIRFGGVVIGPRVR